MIYLDNNATTKIDDEVLKCLYTSLAEDYANASSTQHKLGRQSNHLVQQARRDIAQILNVSPKELFFTSGSTESINTVIKGIFERYQQVGNHIITCKTEHKAVLSTCQQLEKKGAKITYLDVDSKGNIDLQALRNTFCNGTILVALMSANNETGVKHPLDEIAKICTERNVLFFCDATQSIGKEKIDLSLIPIDILCFSAHKFHGPKGIGGLFIRRKSRPIQIESLIIGGKQEDGFRAGTYNTSSIMAMSQALSKSEQVSRTQIKELRDYLENRLATTIEACYIHGIEADRIDNTTNICFRFVKSNALMNQLNNIALSSGSACVSGDRDPSHVLVAMHTAPDDALCSIRFSLSKYTTKEEIDSSIRQIQDAVASLRDSSPIWQMYKEGLLT